MTTADIESFPDDEAPTAILPDRRTPDHQTPARVLQFPRAFSPDAHAPPLDVGTPAVEPTPPQDEPDESAFWDSAPRYSTTSVRPAALPSLAPSRALRRPRSVLAKVLFAALFSGVVALLCYEGSLLLGASPSAASRVLTNRL